MGYYTKHKIEVFSEPGLRVPREELQKIADEIEVRTDYDFDVLDTELNDDHWNDGDGTKFYNFIDIMTAITKKFSHYTFLIELLGEDQIEPDIQEWIDGDFRYIQYGKSSYDDNDL